jgi:5-methylcytosine-specific restriction endonuclease McrA
MIQRMCKGCGSCFYQYNSLQKYCGKCAYNKYAKPKKLITRVGKRAAEWIECRNDWIQQHPPVNGFWECALRISPQCLGFIDIDQLTLDHIKARSTHPDLRLEHTNLQPACYYCNSMKGSSDLT